jgi:hypothetical protein
MREFVFNTQLNNDGSLYCPKEFLYDNAKYKVIVSIQDLNATDSDIELSAIMDNSNDFLSDEEVSYYLNLD